MGQDSLDHDEGIDAIILERAGVLRRPGQLLDGMPFHANGQISKDKDAVTLQVPRLATCAIHVYQALYHVAAGCWQC